MNRIMMAFTERKVLRTPEKKLGYLREYRRDDHAREHDQEWLNNHPNYMREWHAKHREYNRLQSKVWRSLNRNYACVRSRKWRLAHPDYYVLYRQRNSDALRKYWRNYKRKKRSQAVENSINNSTQQPC